MNTLQLQFCYLIRSNINDRMQRALNTFQDANSLTAEFDGRLSSIYTQLREHFVNLFDSIFNTPGLLGMQQTSSDDGKGKLIAKENELLKARVAHLDRSLEKKTPQKQFSRSNSKKKQLETKQLESKLLRMTSEKPESALNKSKVAVTEKSFNANYDFSKCFPRLEAGIPLREIVHKSMTEQQLVDLIKELFPLKKTHDLKSIESGTPRETLELFLFSHFKKKYGLPQVVLEKILAVFLSIQQYSQTNNEVALFGLVNSKGTSQRHR